MPDQQLQLKLFNQGPAVDVMVVARQVGDAWRESYQLGACARLRAVVTRLWPSAQVDVYGSVITGLAVPASDVDVVVSVVPDSQAVKANKAARPPASRRIEDISISWSVIGR